MRGVTATAGSNPALSASAPEAGVHREAIAASKNPLNVVPGYLQQCEVVRDGHTFRTFHGSQITWMQAFMPAGRAVKKINVRPPHEPAQW